MDQTGVINLGLMRLGANPITAIDDGSANGTRVNAVWDYVISEVLQARDWRFAKIRYKMVKNATAPLYTYQYAYTIPADFLRLVKPRYSASKGINPKAYPPGGYYGRGFTDTSAYFRVISYDPPVEPPGYPYVIEALPSGVLVLMTNYDNTADDLYINYIKKETTVNRWSPTFASLVAYKLAETLAVAITESLNKEAEMRQTYKDTLNSATAVNESYDYLDDEAGGTQWEDAGR